MRSVAADPVELRAFAEVFADAALDFPTVEERQKAAMALLLFDAIAEGVGVEDALLVLDDALAEKRIPGVPVVPLRDRLAALADFTTEGETMPDLVSGRRPREAGGGTGRAGGDVRNASGSPSGSVAGEARDEGSDDDNR